jgi:general secretion pathway protein G
MHINNKISDQTGITIIELMLVLALVGILFAFAIPAYKNYRKEARIKTAIADLISIEVVIKDYRLDSGSYPATLDSIGISGKLDPWKKLYQYANHGTVKGKGKMRKDKNLVPINSDFDLYSMGEDGKSVSPLTAPQSHDDIIRANNGAYFGLAKDY